MQNDALRSRHAELVLTLASQDQRLLDLVSQRPYLLNPYPSIVTRLSRRSRRFRQKRLAEVGHGLPSLGLAPWRGRR